MNKVSIVIPVYNTQEFLRECIEHAISQTYQNIEILLIDDGSTDESGKICDYYANKYKNIFAIHKSNGGLVSARNVGIEKASGEYITFVDSDDYIFDNCIEKTVNILEENKVDFVRYKYVKDYFFYRKKNKGNFPYNKVIKKENFYKFINYFFENEEFCPIVCTLSKRKLYKNINVNENITIGEDFDFSMNVLGNSNSFVYLDEGLYYYRTNYNSMTHLTENNEKLLEGLKSVLLANFESKNILTQSLNLHVSNDSKDIRDIYNFKNSLISSNNYREYINFINSKEVYEVCHKKYDKILHINIINFYCKKIKNCQKSLIKKICFNLISKRRPTMKSQ